MEGQLWSLIVAVLATMDKRRKRANQKFSDEEIVKVFYWSVIHDRPVSWACERRNWPLYLRRRPLPSNTTLSRRLRSPSVMALLDAVERRVCAPREQHLYWMIDGKPLAISGCSKDRQAGYGRAARSKAKGYKIHAIVAADGSLANWRVAPMNKDERVMAERLLKTTDLAGYITADANYEQDSQDLRRTRQSAVRFAQAVWRRTQGRPSCTEPRPPPQHRDSGKSRATLRPPIAERSRCDRAALRQRHQLGRRTNPLAALGTHPSTSETMDTS